MRSPLCHVGGMSGNSMGLILGARRSIIFPESVAYWKAGTLAEGWNTHSRSFFIERSALA